MERRTPERSAAAHLSLRRPSGASEEAEAPPVGPDQISRSGAFLYMFSIATERQGILLLIFTIGRRVYPHRLNASFCILAVPDVPLRLRL